MFAETSLIHVVFTTHRARVIGRSTFGHIRTSTDIRVTLYDGLRHGGRIVVVDFHVFDQ